MSISENYPHKIALLQVALRARKLMINDLLKDPAEQAVISSLMVFLDSHDYRAPITVPRKVLGQYSMLARTTLYEKLAALEDRKLIERHEGERAIRFTEYGVSLLVQPGDQQTSPTKPRKKSFFKVGSSSFPKEVIPLLTRGLTEKQVGWLMAEAKKANVMIQEQMAKFGKIIDRYEGKLLFLVFRDFIRKPEKYQYKPAIPKITQNFSERQIKMLHILTSESANANGIIRPDEKVAYQDGLWVFTSPRVLAGAPQPMTDETLAKLEDRFAMASRKAIETLGESIVFEHASSVAPLIWRGEENNGRPLVYSTQLDAGPIEMFWLPIYQALPTECQHWSYLFGEPDVDHRQGGSFVRKGVRYLVEKIEAGRAWLFANNASRTWAENIEVNMLDDASLEWL